MQAKLPANSAASIADTTSFFFIETPLGVLCRPRHSAAIMRQLIHMIAPACFFVYAFYP
jgi:hypothetical protein